MNYPLTIAVTVLLTSSVAFAAPTVTGNTISWPDDGWYQVQRSDNYQSVCEGGASCVVSAGTYIVINHSTGERFIDIVVDELANGIQVSGNTISWPDDGWYQVQSADDYVSVCEGGRSCQVQPGTYIVINHSTGQRFTDIVVSSVTSNSLENIRLQMYSSSAAEIFWEQNDSDRIISSVDVLRDGALIANVLGRSFYDDLRTDGTNHTYTLIAIDTDGNRLEPIDIGQFEDQRLDTGRGALAFNNNGEIALSGDTAVFTADRELHEIGYSGAAYVFTRSASGAWAQTQRVLGEAGSNGFAFSVALDENTMALGQRFIPVADGIDESRGRVTMYERNAEGIWIVSQTLDFVDEDSRVYRFGNYIAMEGDVMLISANNDLNGAKVYAFERNIDGLWEQTQVLTPSVQTTRYQFGEAIAIDGNVAVIGDIGDTVNGSFSGLAYVFTRDASGQWNQHQILVPSTGIESGNAGNSVAISGETIVIGERFGNDAFVFSLGDDGQWVETQMLNPYLATNNVASLRSGTSVSIQSDTIIIGSEDSNSLGFQTGAATVYNRDGAGTWVAAQVLGASDGQRHASFGQTVALDGSTAMVGSYVPGNINRQPGQTAYVYTLSAD